MGGTIHVLYTIVGEEPGDGHFNAFIMPCDLGQEGRGVSWLQIQSSFPLGPHYHFSLQLPTTTASGAAAAEKLSIDLHHPASIVPIHPECRKLVLKAFPMHGDEDSPSSRRTAAALQPQTSSTTTDPSVGAATKAQCSQPYRSSSLESLTEPDLDRRRRRDVEPGKGVGIERRRRSSSLERLPVTTGTAPTGKEEREEEGGGDDRGSTWKSEIKGGLSDLSGQAYDLAKHFNHDAKKWTGSLFSSITSSLSETTHHAAALIRRGRGENVTIGPYNVVVQKEIAHGAFSQVFLVQDPATRETFAMKQVFCQSQDALRDVELEIQVHQCVPNHPHIMPLLAVEDTGSSDRQRRRSSQHREVLFLFPLYRNGSLWDRIVSGLKSTSRREPWIWNETQCLDLFSSICKAVSALHQQGWAHRDIKPQNVLLDDQNQPILIDLGSCARLATSIDTKRQALLLEEEAASKCSAPYRAPELFHVPVPSSIDTQLDVWSLGCTLYCMAFGSSPFESPREGFMKLACLNGNVKFPARGEFRGQMFSKPFCQFIQDMLTPDPHERPSLYDLLDVTQDLLNRK